MIAVAGLIRIRYGKLQQTINNYYLSLVNNKLFFKEDENKISDDYKFIWFVVKLLGIANIIYCKY